VNPYFSRERVQLAFYISCLLDLPILYKMGGI
jgi:hypothetical protein